jgi:8-amino-7-oxononanoate synthase
MATLGKAAGVYGAFVAGEAEVVESLVQRARTYVYTTATPPLLAAAAARSLELIRDGDGLREHLRALVARLRERLRLRRWRLLPSQTAIQPLVIGANDEAMTVSERLAGEGLLVPAIRQPTVPRGTARLRISLSAAHTLSEVERLAGALNRLQ